MLEDLFLKLAEIEVAEFSRHLSYLLLRLNHQSALL